MLAVFDKGELLVLLRDFYELTGLRTVVFDEWGMDILSYPQQLPDYCRLVRATPQGEMGCRLCDQKACRQARMEERTGQPYDWYMDLDITSPLRTESDIENAFAKKQSRDDLDLVFSVCEARRNPWFNMVKTVDDHVEQVCKSEFTGRQQAPDVYDVNASIYVFKRDFLATNTDGMLWRGKIGISVMMDTGIIDIDSEHDYLLMEAIAQHLYAHYPEFAAVQENIRD